MLLPNDWVTWYTTRQPPGHRGFKRALSTIMRSLTQTALTGKPFRSREVKLAIFSLVSEYAIAALDAAAFARKAIVTISNPNESLVFPENLISMLYLDHLIYGVAAFELANDVFVYSDPAQFESIVLQPDGTPLVQLPGGQDVSSRIGVISFSPNPSIFGKSVPEVIPQAFLFFLSFYGRVMYDLSPYRKPDLLIVTTEMLSAEEIINRRRQIIEQAEEDYGNLIIYHHAGEDKPIIQDLTKSEAALSQLAQNLYEDQVALIRSVCGCPDDKGEIPYAITAFFDQLSSEIARLMPESEVSVTLPSLGGED